MPLKVFGLGSKGVNLTDDPLHTDVGDVTQAQNAIFRGSGLSGGLYKRGGLRILNTTTLNGSVLAILAVSLDDPTPGNILTDDDLNTLTDDLFLVLTE